jgi:hypothetical protein
MMLNLPTVTGCASGESAVTVTLPVWESALGETTLDTVTDWPDSRVGSSCTWPPLEGWKKGRRGIRVGALRAARGSRGRAAAAAQAAASSADAAASPLAPKPQKHSPPSRNARQLT